MDYRVVKLCRVGHKLRLKKIYYCGYYLSPEGHLKRNNKQLNTYDRRKSPYYCVDFFSGQKDKLGNKLYNNDVVYSSTLNVEGIIEFRPDKAAFVLMLKQGNIKIPYSFLDCYDVSLKKIKENYN